MSRRARRDRTDRAPADRCTVTVCRGCCCGTSTVPGLDHAAQLTRLRRDLASLAEVRPSGCLDACDHANVIVVQPSPAGRAAGGRPVWLGLVNDNDATGDIITWLRDGGPGLADPPDVLELHVFTPSRRVRQTLDSSFDRPLKLGRVS
jgi:(2Fe-2S) ferredoxin